MDFCKEFNARTAHLTPGTPTPVLITIQPDKSFTFRVKTPPVAWLIKQAAGLGEGRAGSGGMPGKEVANLDVRAIYEIAKIKQRDDHLKGAELQAIAKSIVGTCRSMG